MGLGSNLGEPEGNLREAVRRLEKTGGGRLTAVSDVYFTQPQNEVDQPWFANLVVRMEVAECWTPHQLLLCVKSIEEKMGRVESYRFGPRLIDIDILLFGEMVVNSPDLVVPHPRLCERAFALVPLLEISPRLCLPGGRILGEALEALSYRIVDRSIFQE